MHFQCATYVDPRDATGDRLADRAADQRDRRASITGRPRQGEAHLAAGEVGDAAHRVDALEGRPGGDQDMLPGQHLGLEVGDDGVEDFRCFEHPSFADFATRLFATGWAEQGDAIAAQGGDVALRGRVAPHLAVHRRGEQQRAVARQRQGGEQVVGEAVGKLGKTVRRGRGDEQQVGFAGEGDVRHAVRRVRRPGVGDHRLAGERLEGQRGDEAGGSLAHRHLYGRALFDQQADEFGGLVGGNAASDAEEDVFSAEFHGICRLECWKVMRLILTKLRSNHGNYRLA